MTSTTPTPLQSLPRFSEAVGAPVYIKQDDVGPISWAGTKSRQAARILKRASTDGIRTLVMCGPPHSNSCRIVAAMAAPYAIDIIVLLHGYPPDVPTPNQQILQASNARLRWAGDVSWPALEAQAHKLAASVNTPENPTMVIDPGCSSVDGILAIVDAAAELKDQLLAAQIEATGVIHASASGGLCAGLTIGHHLHGSPKPQSVMIVHDIYPDVLQQYRSMILRTADALNITVPTDDLQLDWSQVGEGYAIATTMADEASALLSRTEGLLVDPVYTAKALAAVIEHGRKSSDPIVFWHSGGLPTFFRQN